MKGTSRRASGGGAGWALAGPASATNTPQKRTASVHRNDDEDQHQQSDDDERGRDHDARLPSGESLIDLLRLRGNPREILAVERGHRGRRTTQVDSCLLGRRLHFRSAEYLEHGFAI